MRDVFIDDDGAVQVYVPIECTGVAARWCPIHGDCTDRGADAEESYSTHCSEWDCPLHGTFSTHAESAGGPPAGTP